MTYEKPLVILNDALAEGVYAASGAGNTASGCDSQYMAGNWQGPDYSDWAGKTRGYKQQFGCMGCPAYTGTGCGMATGNHYDQSGQAASYDANKGNRKPSWEKKGYGPDDAVSDWNM